MSVSQYLVRVCSPQQKEGDRRGRQYQPFSSQLKGTVGAAVQIK